MKHHPLVVGVYGKSKSGKTSLIESLTEKLTKKDYRVATIKHSRGNYTLDKEGKDTWRHGKAGAELTVFASRVETTFMVREDKKLDEIVKALSCLNNWDLVLVEGFKEADIPKIAVGDIELKEGIIGKYRDNIEEIMDRVTQEMEVQRIWNKLPQLDCKKCEFKSCRELALEIYKGDKFFEDCVNLPPKGVSLKVNDEQIPLGHFPANLIKETVKGMASALKGVSEIKSIRVEIED